MPLFTAPPSAPPRAPGTHTARDASNTAGSSTGGGGAHWSTRLMHPEGEIAVGRVAERTGILDALSTMGTTLLEALASSSPGARRWFQADL